ncbi:hypothetical protein PVAND_016908 [Polypedilum vanderplanki]|uniref:Uncharacterized protein n=1 Tax=Polypedilum vanderplanki TaxID=319348 RepID=A0A9J6BGS3_POLVA|nr:hypothetical protein PVAND_016908 [Polypedilum vanderplanki]
MKFQLIFLFIALFAFFGCTYAGGPSLSEYCQQVCALCSGITDPLCDCSLFGARCIEPTTSEDSSFSLESSSEESSSEKQLP